METPARISLGPFFTTEQPNQPPNAQVSPLGLAIEWSSSSQAKRISLFRRITPGAPDRTRLFQILVRCTDLPCDVACLDYQAADTPEGAFLPLEALLVELYRSGAVSRSVFQLLDELATVVPLRNPVANPVSAKRLLAAQFEARGFRLNGVFRESGLTFVQIAWEAESSSTRFHVCTASVRSKPGGGLGEAKWIPQRDIGVSLILSNELHRLAPGKPSELLSEKGFQFLKDASFQRPQEATSQS